MPRPNFIRDENLSNLDKAMRAPLTPVTVAADLGLFVGTVGLLSAALIVGCSEASGKMCH